jgi:transcriptional regulator with XRE-family HTH domain
VTTTCFRLFLQFELQERRLRNPHYSLRAFAQRLGVNHSTLSQWMRGRRPLTAKTIETLGRRLSVPAKHIRVFVEHRASTGPDLAVLELLRREDFTPDSRWIARQLGITVDDVNIAVQRLVRLDLLEMATVNQWIDKSGVC